MTISKSKKIVVTSDSHGKIFHDKIPECDIFIHCGDISPISDHSFYYQQQWFYNDFLEQLKEVPAKKIIFIGGNHDHFLAEIKKSKRNDEIKNALPDNVIYLCGETTKIDNIKIFGSPYVVLPKWGRQGFPVWNFAQSDDSLKSIYNDIENGTDIVISHCPCYGFCDTILEHGETEHLGSESLTNKIRTIKPKYFFNGHIHSANHNEEKIIHDINTQESTKFYCTSLLNESYGIHYKPLIIYF